MPHPLHPPLTHNGAAIRTIRQLKRMSMRELSAAVNITPQSLSNAENERKRVSMRTLNKIALALEVPLAAISRVPVANGQRPARTAESTDHESVA